MAHVEFTYTGASPTTLVADGPAFEVTMFLDLYLTGESVGANLAIADVDGTDARDRDRDEMGASLDWELRGSEDIAGTATAAGGEVAQLRRNIMALTRWFDDAPGREVTVRLVETDGTEWEAIAHHEEWGRWQWHGSHAKTSQLLTVADGLLTEVTP